MKSILIVALLLVLALVNVNAQFMRSALYKESTCSGQAYLDIYVSSTNCTVAPVACAASNSSIYTSLKCATSVPAGGKNTLQINTYTDASCSAAITTSQIFPIDTCISTNDGSSIKSNGCKTMTTFSDSNCKTELNTFDYSALNGSCNSNTKFICNNSHTIGMSILVLAIASLLSVVV